MTKKYIKAVCNWILKGFQPNVSKIKGSTYDGFILFKYMHKYEKFLFIPNKIGAEKM